MSLINVIGGMKNKTMKHIKNSTKFIVVILIYYIILYYLLRATYFAVTWAYELYPGWEAVLHGIAIMFVIITIMYFNNDNDKAKPV
jgi:uncharacterized protein YqhQ